MLRRKAAALNALLEGEERNAPVHPLRFEVSSYFFAQSLAGPERRSVLHFLLRSMSFLTLELLPLCLLLAFQIAFLPEHDAAITALHRLCVVTDGVVLLIVGGARNIAAQTGFWYGLVHILRTSLSTGRGGSAAAGLVLFASFAVATLPSQEDEPYGFFNLDGLFTGLAPTKVPFKWDDQRCRPWAGDRCAFWLTAVVFEQPIDYVSGRAGLFSRNLVVTDNQGLLRKRQLNEGEPSLSLRGRDLRYATFDRSDLRRVDFTAADLSRASLRSADLRNATVDCADKGRGGQDCTNLTRSILTEAKLTGVELRRGRLSGIVLQRVDLQGFDFSSIGLADADFSNALLRGANFSSAYLAGANLSEVVAEGARFNRAAMQATDLTGARLDGVDFTEADLSGASMGGASLIATDLTEARLFGTFLRKASIWRTFPSARKAYTFSDLGDLRIAKPSEYDTENFKKVLRILQSLGLDHGWGRKPWKFLVDDAEWEAWGTSDDAQTWKSLLIETDKPAEFRSVGRYFGEIACRDESVLHGILRARFAIYDSFYGGYLGYGTTASVLPPGVDEADLRQFEYSGGYVAAPSVLPPKFVEQLDLAAAFYERLREGNCVSTKRVPSIVLEKVREEIEERRRRAGSEPAGTLRNIETPPVVTK